jgi:SNF2 family DNA or RNA helicase
VAGVAVDEEQLGDPSDPDWSTVSAGPWLAETLKGLRSPDGLARIEPGPALQASLRPYQQAGVRWLYLLHRLGLGACLADDMGLGKTIQVLSLLLILKHESTAQRAATPTRTPSLLVAPASLLANWAAEIERFAPTLRFLIAHPSASSAEDLKAMTSETLAVVDLVITSYGALLRYDWLSSTQWRVLVIDEAQAIKNPGAKQTRAVKQLIAHTRIALTGTPVENRLGDLWSIFDFTHPGLLGSGQAFGRYVRRLAEAKTYRPLRELVRPYILRRLKTDKSVIVDLPDKTEMKAFCYLGATQAALYQKAVEELAHALDRAEGMGRKGVVLSFLMRFKQICNHPSQWLGDGAWAETESGKFARLRELAEVIAAKQEKMLVFTQFREATQPIAAFLGHVFGREGLILHGGTPVSKRRELVRRFQDDELTPFFVLSLKAGGAGLNLTAASHVVHFDRWWNPAVENQATDRAFRIGQSRNVLVHKFVCRGTVEDKIDQLIESKQTLVKDVLEGGAELQLTELSDKELLDLVALDIHSAQANV